MQDVQYSIIIYYTPMRVKSQSGNAYFRKKDEYFHFYVFFNRIHAQIKTTKPRTAISVRG